MKLGEGSELGKVSGEGTGDVIGSETELLEGRQPAEGVGRDRSDEPHGRQAEADDASLVVVAGDADPVVADGGKRIPVERSAMADVVDEVEQSDPVEQRLGSHRRRGPETEEERNEEGEGGLHAPPFPFPNRRARRNRNNDAINSYCCDIPAPRIVPFFPASPQKKRKMIKKKPSVK